MNNPSLIDDQINSLVDEVEKEFRAECHRIERQFNLPSYDEEAERICANYGLTNAAPHEVRKVLLVEREQRECLSCNGLPCKKRSFDKGAIPKVEIIGNQVYSRYHFCQYQLAEMKRLKELREVEKEKEKRAQALKSARLPKRYLGKTLAQYKTDANNKDAVYFAEHSLELNLGAFLFGACGCGKTLLAAIVAQMWLDAGKSVVFIKVPALLDDIRATYNGDGVESDIYQVMQNVDLLVLDDLGMEKPSRFAGTTLCKIIDARYDNDAATVITSNNSLDKVEYDLNHAHDGENLNGSRIADRLREFCRPIKIKGGSRR